MPTNDRRWLNDGEDPQDRREPMKVPDQEQPIKVRETDPAANLTPQHHHPMPKCRVLGLKPALRFERQGENSKDEINERQHCALTLGDSLS